MNIDLYISFSRTIKWRMNGFDLVEYSEWIWCTLVKTSSSNEAQG